ncbi:MAG: DUF1549 domain-containing protein, partial [Planctomycetes bacterium]|nr:DUF1549 domain-containing protein [Planctomycetota bacterium]
ISRRIATGFHRNTRMNNEGGIDPEEYRVADVVDRTNTTATVWLGTTLACAQCHDHPFAHWTQAEFEGLAAHFGQTKFSIVGVEDKPMRKNKESKKMETIEYEVDDYETEDGETEDGATPKKRVVPPAVPFGTEWLPKSGSRRERLAGWITHPQNRRFERAIVCRVWAYLFGKTFGYLIGNPLGSDPPVDDLPDPADLKKPGSEPDVLDILGADFREHGYDLKRLILVITASRPFLLASTHSEDNDGGDPQRVERLLKQGAVFPLTRLRPEQVIGAMIQSGSIRTIDQNSHLVVRFFRFVNENNFVKEYGDLGEDELQEHTGTLPQALLRMNGKFGGNILTANPFPASGRIVSSAVSEIMAFPRFRNPQFSAGPRACPGLNERKRRVSRSAIRNPQCSAHSRGGFRANQCDP